MAGTKIGGQKAARTNIELHGKDFYRIIGSKGGQQKPSKPRGFAANKKLAKIAGTKGGKKSRRTGVSTGQRKEKEYIWKGGPDAELVFEKEK